MGTLWTRPTCKAGVLVTNGANDQRIGTLKQSGASAFSIIELAIVLLIIGLIIGAILAGQALIRAAQLRSEINQLTSFRAGISTFQLKYRSLPGDMPDATAKIGGVTRNGNGDGALMWPVGAVPPTWIDGEQEYYTIWEHLSKSGLITGDYTGNYTTSSAFGGFGCTPKIDCPVSKIRSDGIIVAGDPCNWNGSATYRTCSQTNWFMIFNTAGYLKGAYNVDMAQDLDTKMDDGKPDTGSVLTINGDYTATGCVTGGWHTTDGSVTYDLAGSSSNCSLYISF